MKFGKAVKSNVLQTIRITHNVSNDVFISNNIINTDLLTNSMERPDGKWILNFLSLYLKSTLKIPELKPLKGCS